jgi:hypothetical protein
MDPQYMKTTAIPNSLLEIFNLEQINMDTGSNPFYMELFSFGNYVSNHTNNGLIESLIENQINCMTY